MAEKRVPSIRTRREFEKVQKDFEKIVFERQESNQAHNPYAQEEHEQRSIEEGDLDALEDSFREFDEKNVGIFSKNRLRQMKDMGITVIALASRSAIRGGISPEISFSFSDSIVQHIETLDDPDAVIELVRESERRYARMVKENQQKEKDVRSLSGNPYVRQAKDYIFSHLHVKLTVKGIAEALHVSPNYLSAVFSRQEGITLTRYIIYEKVNRAKNMLTYSDYSCSDIAQYLGFSSQSHLGVYFRQATGYTLMQFRKRFGVAPDKS
ncbi:MAG: AraC family transcriptional regulator [Eubacteriales bacterium]|jgi:AraC-like DNA-binding protein